jgi:hypothetical protein
MRTPRSSLMLLLSPLASYSNSRDYRYRNQQEHQ